MSVKRPSTTLRNQLTVLLLLAIGLGVKPSAFGAEPLVCEATVASVQVTRQGVVLAELDGDWGREVFNLCRLDQTDGPVLPAACRAFKDQLFVALVADKPVSIISKDKIEEVDVPPDEGPASCDQWLEYGDVNWPELYKYVRTFIVKAE
ncbi:MAG: hypothetical protein AAGC60_03630 [Acidobacteriota bacterium]